MTLALNLALNWKEIEALCGAFRPGIEGLFVDRIIVPERPRFLSGYLKGESAIRLTGRRQEGTLLFSIRPRQPYLAFSPGKGPRAAAQATRSPFDQEVSKHLKGQKLLKVEVPPRERSVILWFSDPEARKQGDRMGLVLNLIPASPEALLIRDEGGPPPWKIVTRSRLAKAPSEAGFIPADGAQAPPDLARRDALILNYPKIVEETLAAEAFATRLAAASRELRALAKQARERIRQTATALREAEADRDWQRYGDVMKSALHELPPIEDGHRVLPDFAREGDRLRVPMDPKLGPSEQVEKFYQLARRRSRRLSEARGRIESLTEARDRLEGLLSTAPVLPDWKGLEALERAAQIQPATPGAPRKKAGGWLGKTFVSRDGLTILVGRSRDENLELTFKQARGNDLWLHVRGRPGAHVLVPLQPGKSAPLETLLDAATLAIYYSGGENWGKTEVDYTFKKHVKRIKDSTEASYTHNKTLLVDPDPQRIKRLQSVV